MISEPVPIHRGHNLPPGMEALPQGDLLLRYQGEAIDLMNSSALTLIDKSRRIGLTWGIAADAVLVAASARGEGGMDVFYTSYNLDMTREFIDACAMWAKSYGMGLMTIGEFLFDDTDAHGASKQIKAFRIDFASGYSVVALSSAVGRHGDRVQGVLFTGPNKLDMATAMKKRFEDGTIRIPSDAAIRTDFRAIKKSKARGDTVRLVNDETVHADLFWACALACLMADTDAPAYRGYIPAPKSRKYDEPADARDDGMPGEMRMRADEQPRGGARFRRGGTW